MSRGKRGAEARAVTRAPVIQRHDDILEPIYEADPDGRPVVHHRVVDTIGRMLRDRQHHSRDARRRARLRGDVHDRTL